MGRASGHVTSGNAYNNKEISCCGFAASGNTEDLKLQAAYLQVDFDWALNWDEPTNMILTISSLRFRQTDPGLINSEYHWWFGVQRDSETLGRTPTSNTIWNVDLYKYIGAGTSREPFDYTSPDTYAFSIGSAWDWGFNDGGDMLLYFGGCSSYEVTVEPIYPVNVQIALKNDTPIYTLLEYFPCSVRSGTQWLSCNRTGGSFQKKAAGVWIDRKNVEKGDGTQDDTVFIRTGGSWVKAPKIGLNA